MDVHSNGRRVMLPNFVKGSNEYPNQAYLKINLVVILICICVVMFYIINCNCFITMCTDKNVDVGFSVHHVIRE